MRCSKCEGYGMIRYPARDGDYNEEPCPDCNGSGIIHCCEGEQTQGEEKSVGTDKRKQTSSFL